MELDIPDPTSDRAVAGQKMFANPQLIVPFLRSIVSATTMAKAPDAAIMQGMSWMLYIVGNGNPEDPFGALPPSTSACGQSWGPDELAYRCNTCALDPSCAVCVPCFNNGDHTGHDYRMIRAGGGMCDCGDPSAWAPAGNCKNHKGADEGTDPTEGMDPKLKEAMVLCCYMLWEWYLNLSDAYGALIHKEKRPDAPSQDSKDAVRKTLTVITSWMGSFIQRGDAAKRIVSFALARTDIQHASLWADKSEADEEQCNLLTKLFELEFDELGDAFYEQLHQFYFPTLTDYHFKLTFARTYMDMYDQLSLSPETRRMRPGRRRRSMGLKTFSVQFLTVPSIIQALNKSDTKPPMIWTLLYTLKKIADKLKVTKKIGGHEVTKLHCGRWPDAPDEDTRESFREVAQDLKYILTISPTLACDFLLEPTQLEIIFDIILMVHGAVAVERKDSDDRSWAACADYENELSNILHCIAKGVRHTMQQDPNTLKNIPAPVIQLLDQIVDYLGEHFAEIQIHSPTANPPKDCQAPWLLAFSPLTHPFSLYLPLHRLLALVINACCSSAQSMPIHKIFPPKCVHGSFAFGEKNPEPFMAVLMEHPLAIQAVRGQACNSLWNRNNMSILNQIDWYECPYSRAYLWAQDIFLLQCAALLLGPSYYVTSVVERYKIIYKQDAGHVHIRPVQTTMPENPLREPQKLAEDMMIHIIATAMDRTNCGNTRTQIIRRHLVHRLAAGQCTHSELLDAAPKIRTDEEDMDQTERDIDEIIPEIADFVPPSTASTQGFFTLKKEAWKEVDLYFPLLHRMNQTSILANRKKALGKDASGHPPVYVSPLPYESFHPLLAVLHCEITHSLAFTMLYNWKNRSGTHTDTFPAVALDVISLSLQTLDLFKLNVSGNAYWMRREKEFYQHIRPHATHTYPIAQLASTTDIIANLKGEIKTSDGVVNPSTLHLIMELSNNRDIQDYKDTVDSILQTLSSLDPECRDLIAQHNQSKDDGNQAEEEERLKAKRMKQIKRKQAEAMAKMNSAQSQFEALLGDDDSEEEDEFSKGMETNIVNHLADMSNLLLEERCALCHEVQSPNGNTPLGFICNVTRSSVLKQTVAQARELDMQLPTVALQADGKELKDALGPETDMTVTTPVFTDLNSTNNTHLHFCGHALHLDCFDSYHKFLCKAHSQMHSYKGSNFLHLGRGEFLCPFCGRLGNTVCPVVTESESWALRDNPSLDNLLVPSATATATPTMTMASVSSNDTGLWGDMVIYMEERFTCRTDRITLSTPESEQRMDDAQEAFVNAMCSMLTNCDSTGDSNPYRGAKDNFTAAIHCLGMYVSATEVTARANTLENGILHIPIRTAGLLRTTMRAVLAFGRSKPAPGMDAHALINCLSGKSPEVIIEQHAKANPSSDDVELRWAPILSCDSFSIWIQVLMHIILRDPTFNSKHYHMLLRRVLKAQTLRATIALLACDPTIKLPLALEGEVVPDTSFVSLCGRMQEFLLQDMYSNPTEVSSKPRTPVEKGPDPMNLSFSSNPNTPTLSPTQPPTQPPSASTSSSPTPSPSLSPSLPQYVYKSSSSSASPSSFPSSTSFFARAANGPISDIKSMAQLYSAVSSALLPFLRRTALLHYALTGEPLPHVPGKVNDSSTHSVSSAPGPPLMEADPEVDVVALEVLSKYLHLPGDDNLLQGLCEDLMGPSESLRERFLRQLYAATTKPAMEKQSSAKPMDIDRPSTNAPENSGNAEGLASGEPSPDTDSVDEAEFVPKGCVLPIIPQHQGSNRPYSLISLPLQYQPLAQVAYKARCTNCPTTEPPDHPALCLKCGELVCCKAACCAKESFTPSLGLSRKVGECNQHAMSCGGGVGVFLLVKVSNLLVIRNERFAFLPSLYLDAHGEEDRELARGRPLFLSKSRLHQLRDLVANSGFDHDTRVLNVTYNSLHNSSWFDY